MNNFDLCFYTLGNILIILNYAKKKKIMKKIDWQISYRTNKNHLLAPIILSFTNYILKCYLCFFIILYA